MTMPRESSHVTVIRIRDCIQCMKAMAAIGCFFERTDMLSHAFQVYVCISCTLLEDGRKKPCPARARKPSQTEKLQDGA